MSNKVTLDRDKIAFLISDLCDKYLEYDPQLGICGAGTVAFAAADQIIAFGRGGAVRRIEYVSGQPEYDETRSRGWYVADDDTGKCEGPFFTRADAEYAAGRPDDGKAAW